MKYHLINLTGHEITLFDDIGNRLTIPPSGEKLRVDSRKHEVGYVAKYPVQVPVIIMNRQINREALPKRKRNTVYIVGLATAMAYPERDDFIVPGTKVRDSAGNIIGCRDFKMIV